MKRFLLATLLVGISTTVFSQSEPEWFQMMESENPNFFEVEEAYEAYYETHAFTKNRFTQDHKRWVREVERYVQRDGSIHFPRIPYNEALESLQASQSARGGAVWTPIGPFHVDTDAAGNSYAPGFTRFNTIEQAPGNPNLVYAGTATTGLWKSTNQGLDWDCVTLDQPFTGVRSICISHANNDHVWFGGGGASIMRSTDGGQTWTNTTINNGGPGNDIWEIKMHPTDPNILLAAGSDGWLRSTDGGSVWTELFDSYFYEIEFHPTNPNIVYVIERENDHNNFLKSTDAGITFSHITNGVPVPDENNGEHNRRSEIAVTPAAPNNVYWLAPGAANGGAGLYGFYVSTDSGDSWEFRCCGTGPGGTADAATNPNIMDWSTDGSDDGGQYYYDLGLAVSATDPNTIYTAGINIWVSTDGGYNFTNNHHWTWGDGIGYVHADVHDLKIFGNDFWAVSDGGAFHSVDGGVNFADKTRDINGTEIWGWGAGFREGYVQAMGTYHNGTLLLNNDVWDGWLHVWGGDQYDGFVNPVEKNLVYADWAGLDKITLPAEDQTAPSGGSLNRDINHFSYHDFHPHNPYGIYVPDGDGLWLTMDNGNSWALIHDFGEEVRSVRVAPKAPNVIYVATKIGYWDDARLWLTVDGGDNWTEITPNSTLTGGHAWRGFDITVDGDNPSHVWVSIAGTHQGSNVLRSYDGGASWVDISTNLPETEVQDIVHHIGTDGGVYIGTSDGVFYTNNQMGSWTYHANDLPLAYTRTLQVWYNGGKIFNATTGRGVWEAPLFEVPAPVANLGSDLTTVDCLNQEVRFFDLSYMDTTNATYSWSFPGGVPSTSTDRDPVVNYPNPGSYDVSLTVTNNDGTDSFTIDDFIEHVAEAADTPFEEDFEGAALPQYWNIDNPDDSYTWTIIELDTGVTCDPTTAYFMNHHPYNNPPAEDYLYSQLVDLEFIQNAELTLDYAYTRWGSGYEDGFRVEISTNCGASWDTLFDECCVDLMTIPDNVQDPWQPGCGDWASLNFDLSGYYGQTVLIRFVGVNGWGNNFYMDNVNVDGLNVVSIGQLDSKAVRMYPNPANDRLYIWSEFDQLDLTIMNMTGQTMQTEQLIGTGNHQIDLNELSSGVYFVRMQTSDGERVEKLVIQ